MTPFYLGTSRRRLFGIHEPPTLQMRRARAAVLCAPWGPEYVYAHRSLRHLAGELSAAGYHTLRFDFFGTGDSGGDMPDADLPGWVEDAATAIDTLKDIAGTARVTLIGLRLGGNIAATAAARFADQVDALVLWDPIVSGRRYVEALLAHARATRANAVAQSGATRESPTIEVQGFALTAALRRQMAAIDLRQTEIRHGRSLMLVTQPGASLDALDWPAAGANPPPAVEFVSASCPWIDTAALTGAVPAAATARIVEWLR